jgi:hypothetical protein
MNRIGRISLGMVALLALSAIATAKNAQPVAVATAKPDIAVAAPVPAPPSEVKPAKVAAKRNAAATTETEPTRDPYAVPLFQQARPLKLLK